MRGRRFLEHTSDVYVEAIGPDLRAAFEEAALALFETLITNLESVTPANRLEVYAEGYDTLSLLYDWLEKLLLLFEIDRFVARYVKVLSLKEGETYRVEGEAWGESYDESRHKPGTHVKSPTYWLMEVVKENDMSVVRFVLDI